MSPSELTSGAPEPLGALLTTIRDAVQDARDDSLSAEQATEWVHALAEAGRLIDGAITLLADRAANAPRTASDTKRAAIHLATALGGGTTAARKRLRTSRQLIDQPVTSEAVATGRLSTAQAAAIASAVDADPSAASELVEAARTLSFADLRATCRTVRAAADPDREATQRRHQDNRHFTSWIDEEGMYRANIGGPSAMGARIEAALRPEHDATFAAAHAAGRSEPDAAHRFDALVTLLERGADCSVTNDYAPATSGESPAPADESPGDPTRGPVHSRCTSGRRRSGRQTKVVVLVDGAALVRGERAPGETCRIEGIGEVPLSAALEQMPVAHISYVIANATDSAVAHLGRQATAAQRTALLARGYECEVPSCRATHLLEIDHVRDWAWNKRTRLQDLAWLCSAHHRLKTRRQYRLEGPPGRRRWVNGRGSEVGRDPPAAA